VCDNLKRVYPARDGNPPKYAVKGFSLAVPKGECFGILGPNGAGKTSSINMVSTLTTFLIFHISSLGVFLNWLEFWEC
jgi:ABC-type multidrug transport system ATPase subunit